MAWNTYHQSLCFPSDNPEHPLSILEQLAYEVDGALICSRILATIIQETKKNGGDITKASKPYRMFISEKWWSLIPNPSGSDVTDDVWIDGLKQRVVDAITLLKAGIQVDPSIHSLFSIDFFGSLLGIIEMNSVELVVPSPVTLYFSQLQERNLINSVTNEIWNDIESNSKHDDDDEKVEDIPPPCYGTALCAIQGTINHSCSPNVEVRKENLDWHGDTMVFALKDIKMGEELFISYIDENQSYEERQQSLKFPYLFDCKCEKCLTDQKLSVVK
eukprot:TRINITY_DN2612_c0_g1_i5.p1 TRINITY_DN2612_c0_g1~~TRINITY_DN2612_c0_g1_i5.p1  ORF type:complete len:274 (+),score=37.66 TRINITY_DN2612_c0_g1_i5:478-1299(+)